MGLFLWARKIILINTTEIDWSSDFWHVQCDVMVAFLTYVCPECTVAPLHLETLILA